MTYVKDLTDYVEIGLVYQFAESKWGKSIYEEGDRLFITPRADFNYAGLWNNTQS